MPIHDWTKTYAGAFHHFHMTWLVEIARSLNSGLLPPGYYALGEQVIGGAVPNVLTLDARRAVEPPSGVHDEIEVKPGDLPSATMTAVSERPQVRPPARVIAVRHVSGQRLVAMVEIVSSENKTDSTDLGAFVDKTVGALSKGIHVVLIDLHPPGALDPQGVHNLVWMRLGEPPMPLPPGRPLQVVSYRSAGSIACFVEPRAVGESLPDAPLFLSPARHVSLPLEATYEAASAALPRQVWEPVEGG
ncbi:MAG: DUF4058 domain-containing protein [Planctomycetes bacterium]|nr:DUF4058 domain-containing protein [Planctomycetota bacterium]